MQSQTHQDPSTQAMTEVALGLSMAFFSLLILALFSIGLPEQVQLSNVVETIQGISKEHQLSLTGSSDKSAEHSDKPQNQQQFVFYFDGMFYNQQLSILQPNDIADFDPQAPLILAVKDTLPLAKIMSLRQQINNPNLSITTLNQEWLTQLEQIQ